MSKEAVEKFYEILKNNEALQEQVNTTNSSASVVQIAANNGYEFTERELETLMQEAMTNKLFEQELAGVAVGSISICKVRKWRRTD
jgi:predicted ribosomally synthesized peptide with nif11-like leader